MPEASDLGQLTGLVAAGARPEAGALAALAAGMAADVVGAATSEAGLRAQAVALARRAANLARLNTAHHGAAVAVLAGRAHPDPQGVMRAAGTSPLTIAELAADVAQLAAIVADAEPVAVAADAAAAAALAAGAVAAAEQLVRVNLLMRGDARALDAIGALVDASRSAARRAADAVA